MLKPLAVLFVLFAGFSVASEITLILESSTNNIVGGIDVLNMNYFVTGIENVLTKTGEMVIFI